MVIKKELTYPIFLECIQYTTDSFWACIFEDLAYGKTPHGVYISKDSLCCGYKKKDFCYRVEQKDAKTVHDEVHNLLHNRLGILSHGERNKKLHEFNKIAESVQERNMEWSDIKKKNTKEQLIELYVDDMKEKYEFSVKKARQLLSLIYISMMFKVIGNKDIHYSDGVIKSIDGITFKKGDFQMNRPIYEKEVEFAPEIIVENKTLSEKWPEYLKALSKTAKA